MTTSQNKPKAAILKAPSECAGGPVDKVKCTLLGPDWVEQNTNYTSSLDEVTERCRRCSITRLRPQW